MAIIHLTIIDSWKLSHVNEVIADLQHSLNGIMPGTLLKSSATGSMWKVLFRVIFIQVENQKRFEGEKERVLHFSFDAPKAENVESFEIKIKAQESQGIYQYVLETLGHSAKPYIGEKLEVNLLQNSA
jgi:hypothetical protein